MNPQKTARVAPSSVLNRKIGPDKPVHQGANTSVKINRPLSPDVVLPSSSHASVDSFPEQDEIDKLTAEAREAKQLHMNVTASLPDSSPLKYAGQILSDVIQNMTPGGTAIIAPVLEDFRAKATAVTDQAMTDPVTESMSSVPIRALLEYISTLPAAQRGYLATATNLLLSREQAGTGRTINADFRLIQDILLGYSTTTSSLAVLAEQIATYGPRIWGELGRDMTTPGLESLASSISDLSREVWTAYASVNGQVLSSHNELARSTKKRTDTVQKLSSLAATSHVVSQAVRIFEQQTSVDLDASEAQLRQQLSSLIKNTVNSFLGKIENQLKNSLTRKKKNIDASNSAELLKLLQQNSK